MFAVAGQSQFRQRRADIKQRSSRYSKMDGKCMCALRINENYILISGRQRYFFKHKCTYIKYHYQQRVTSGFSIIFERLEIFSK